MSIKSDLRKDGIEVVEKLDTLKINSIAMNISKKICDTFPEYGLNQNNLFIRLSRLNMYKAKMPDGMAEANYFYKNTSIYFNEHIKDEDIEIKKGDCIGQAIFQKYFVADNDVAEGERTGGFGSTSK